MRLLLLTLCFLVITGFHAHARRSLMDDAFSRPSVYTENRMRMERARAEWKTEQYRSRIERSRYFSNELRRRDYIRNQSHINKVLENQRKEQYKRYK